MKEEKKDPVALHLGTHFVRSVSPVALSLGACIVSRSGALATSVEDGPDLRLPADEVAAPLFVGNVGTGPFLGDDDATARRLCLKAYLANMEAGKDQDLEGLESLEYVRVDRDGSAQKLSSVPDLNLFCRSVHFENLVSLDPDQSLSDNSLQHRVGVIQDFFASPTQEVDGYHNIGSVGPVNKDTIKNIYTALYDTIANEAKQKHLMIALTASTTSRNGPGSWQQPMWGNYDDPMPNLKYATGRGLAPPKPQTPGIFEEGFSMVHPAFRNNRPLVDGHAAFERVTIHAGNDANNEAPLLHTLPQNFDPSPYIMKRGNVTEKKLVYVETNDRTCKQLLKQTGCDSMVYRALDYCKPTQKFVTVRKEKLHCEKCTGLELFASCQLDKKLLEERTVEVTMIFRRQNGLTNRPGVQLDGHLPAAGGAAGPDHYNAHRSLTPAEASSMCGGPLTRLDPDKHLCTTNDGHLYPQRDVNPRPPPPREHAVVTGMPVYKSYPLLRPPMKPTNGNNWLTNSKFIEFADEKSRLYLRIGVSGDEVYPIFASNDASNCSGMSIDMNDRVANAISQKLKSRKFSICMPTFKGSKVVLPQLTKGGKSVESFLKAGNNEQSVLKSQGIEPKQNDTMETTTAEVQKDKAKKRSRKSKKHLKRSHPSKNRRASTGRKYKMKKVSPRRRRDSSRKTTKNRKNRRSQSGGSNKKRSKRD